MKISIRQILASAAGAAAAVAIASLFGVKGTIVGAAIGSVAATTGTALVAQSIERTHHAVRQVAVRAPESSLLRRIGGTGSTGAVTETVAEPVAPVTEEITSSEARGESGTVTEITSPHPPTAVLPKRPVPDTPSRLNWRVVAVSAVIVFVLVLVVITAVELLAGRPVSDLVGGSSNGSGTTFFGGSTPTTVPTPAPTTTTVAPATTTTAPSHATTTNGVSTTTTTAVPTTSTTLPGATSGGQATTTTRPGSG